MEYLDVESILNITETCSYFLKLAQHKTISNRFLVKIKSNQEIFKNSSRDFNYRLKYENISSFENFQSNNIKEMIIEGISINNFFQLLREIRSIDNLKILVIKDCKILYDKKPIELIQPKMSLESLVFKSNYIFAYQLNYLLSSIIKLINLDYSLEDQMDTEVDKCIRDFLCNPEFSLSLKELHVQSSFNCFEPVLDSNHFNLTKFSINCYRPTLKLNNLKSFLNKQTNLIYLGIKFNPNNFSGLFPLMKSVCSKIQTLKYISFGFGHQVIENVNDLDFIWKYKGIEISDLKLHYFETLTNDNKLEELHLSNVRLYYICIKFQCLPNLTSLYLHKAILDSSSYHAIFRHLLQLRKLCITDTIQVSS